MGMSSYLAKSLFSGGMREATNENCAIRVANDLGVAEGIIWCKLESGQEEKVSICEIRGRKREILKKTYRGQRKSKAKHGIRRCRGGQYRCRRCFLLESDDMHRRRTLNLCCSYSFLFAVSVDWFCNFAGECERYEATQLCRFKLVLPAVFVKPNKSII